MCVGSSPLPASTQCDVVLSKMSVESHITAASQQHAAAAARTLVTAGTLAQSAHHASTQLHSDGQPAQQTDSTDGSGQEPDVLC